MAAGSTRFVRVVGLVIAASVCCLAFPQDTAADKLIEQAERQAWLKVWTRAAPLYTEVARLFAPRGDRRNTVYAEINHFRGELPRLSVPEASQRLGEYLHDPLLQSDD